MPPVNETISRNNIIINHETEDENRYPIGLLPLFLPILFLIVMMIICKMQIYLLCRNSIDNTDDSRSISSTGDWSIDSVNIDPEQESDNMEQTQFIFFIDGMLQFRMNTLTDTNDTCSICVSDYQDGDLIAEMPCGHKFHKECIHPWLRNNINCNVNPNCPLCREKLGVKYHRDGDIVKFV